MSNNRAINNGGTHGQGNVKKSNKIVADIGRQRAPPTVPNDPSLEQFAQPDSFFTAPIREVSPIRLTTAASQDSDHILRPDEPFYVRERRFSLPANPTQTSVTEQQNETQIHPMINEVEDENADKELPVQVFANEESPSQSPVIGQNETQMHPMINEVPVTEQIPIENAEELNELYAWPAIPKSNRDKEAVEKYEEHQRIVFGKIADLLEQEKNEKPADVYKQEDISFGTSTPIHPMGGKESDKLYKDVCGVKMTGLFGSLGNEDKRCYSPELRLSGIRAFNDGGLKYTFNSTFETSRAGFIEYAFAWLVQSENQKKALDEIDRKDPELKQFLLNVGLHKINSYETMSIGRAIERGMQKPPGYECGNYYDLAADNTFAFKKFPEFYPAEGLIIDSSDGLQGLIQKIKDAVGMICDQEKLAVAVDTEFCNKSRPASSKAPKKVTATFQLAFRAKTFAYSCVVDMIELATCPELLLELDKLLYANDKILIIEHDKREDSENFKASLQHRTNIAPTPIHPMKFVDLQHLVKRTRFYAKLSRKDTYGLSELVNCALDMNFLKLETDCFWLHRPLRQSMIEYAALDAVATLLLYELFNQNLLQER